MKFLTVTRSDPSGRILIPKEIRKSYQLKEGPVELFFKNPGIYMRAAVEKPAGIIRRLNAQGRMSIPSTYRKQMDWRYEIGIEIYHFTDEYLYLQMDQRVCVFCSSTDVEKMVPVRKKYICEDCLQEALGNRLIRNLDKIGVSHYGKNSDDD